MGMKNGVKHSEEVIMKTGFLFSKHQMKVILLQVTLKSKLHPMLGLSRLTRKEMKSGMRFMIMDNGNALIQ